MNFNSDFAILKQRCIVFLDRKTISPNTRKLRKKIENELAPKLKY
jgi:hypothetical protein